MSSTYFHIAILIHCEGRLCSTFCRFLQTVAHHEGYCHLFPKTTAPFSPRKLAKVHSIEKFERCEDCLNASHSNPA
jgi:hypothetical protein